MLKQTSLNDTNKSPDKSKDATMPSKDNIKTLIKEWLSIKKTNTSLSKGIIKEITSLTIKEKIYESLNNEARYLNWLNQKYIAYWKSVQALRITFQNNRNNVHKERNALRKEFKDFVNLMEKNENIIASYTTGNQALKVENEKIINNKQTEQAFIRNKNKEMISKIEMQQNEIKAWVDRQSNWRKNKKDEWERYKREDNDLQDRMKRWEEEMKYYKDKFQLFNSYSVRNDWDEDIGKEQIKSKRKLMDEDWQIQWTEKQLENQNLLAEFNEIKTKVDSLKSELFLAEKLQRKLERSVSYKLYSNFSRSQTPKIGLLMSKKTDSSSSTNVNSRTPSSQIFQCQGRNALCFNKSCSGNTKNWSNSQRFQY